MRVSILKEVYKSTNHFHDNEIVCISFCIVGIIEIIVFLCNWSTVKGYLRLPMAEFLPLSQQIELLFEVRQHPDGRPYTMQEVSNATSLSVAAISQMRHGKIKYPQLNTLRSLCQFFDVPLRYFETQTTDECYAIFNGDNQPPDIAINEIAFRANALSEQAQRDILNMIKWVQAAEKQRKLEGNTTPLPGLEPYDDE